MLPPLVEALSSLAYNKMGNTVENGRPITNYQLEQYQMTVDPNDTMDTVDSVKGWKEVSAVFSRLVGLMYTIPETKFHMLLLITKRKV